MLRAAPPIQSPSASFMSALAEIIERLPGGSGPALGFDEEHRLFVTVVAEGGVIVYWQIECCRDRDEARQLVARCKASAAEAAAAVASAHH